MACNIYYTVPPKQMKITNEKGMEVGDVIGPFDEGATLILVCIVTGGKKKQKQFTEFN